MFELNQLDKLVSEYTPLKIAIENCIKDNIFVRKGFNKNIYKLTNEKLTQAITLLLKDTLCNYICIGLNNTIEWTPIKLFQSAYFMIKIDNNFWIVERNNIKCNVVLIISMMDYMDRLIEISRESVYLESKYWPTIDEFNIVLKSVVNQITLIKKTILNDNTQMNHFLYKYNNNNYYYICIHYSKTHTMIYKPIVI